MLQGRGMVSQRTDLSHRCAERQTHTHQGSSTSVVLTFQDAVDCRLQCGICVVVGCCGERRGVKGLNGDRGHVEGRLALRLSTCCCRKRRVVTWGVTVARHQAAGREALLCSLQFHDALVVQRWRVESVWCHSPTTPSRVSVPRLGV